MFINLFPARIKASAHFVFYIYGKWGVKTCLTRLWKLQAISNEYGALLFIYIVGSWRELNMLGRTMEIQRNFEWICGERNQYYWNMKKSGGYRKRKWNENNLRCLIRIVLSNIVLKITNCLLPFIVLLSSIRKLQISYV